MKASPFSVFIQTASVGLVSLYVLYFLIDYHTNVLVGFSMREGFMIAGEILVLVAIILACDLDEDRVKSEQEKTIKTFEPIVIYLAEFYKNPVTMNNHNTVNKLKKTTAGKPLSAEHKAKISKSLKALNHHKKLVKSSKK